MPVNSIVLRRKLLLASLWALLLFGSTAFAFPELPRSIEPLHEKPDYQNQCPGTMNRYHFRPIGYKAKKPSKSSQAGEALYSRLACAQCHAISAQGGELGPALDGVGAYRGRTWLVRHLTDAQSLKDAFPSMLKERSNIMPHSGINVTEAEQLADYLLTLKEPKGGFSVTYHKVKSHKKQVAKEWKPKPSDQRSQIGRELFFGLRCAACHSLDGSKDRFGPDLAGIGARISEADLHEILNGSVKSSVMKVQAKNLSPEEIDLIQSFLLTLPSKGKG